MDVPREPQQTLPKPRKGEELLVRVERLDARSRARGTSVGGAAGWDVDLRRAMPGELVRARVQGRRKGRLQAGVLEVLERGPQGVEPRCKHAGSCGGCTTQGLAYAAQLALKRAWIGEALRAQGIGQPEVDPVLGCEPPWHYRNKMELTFGARRFIEAREPEGAESSFALGLHAPRRFDKVLDVEECHIVFAEAPPIINDARRLARELELAPWDVREHRGLLRHLVLRKGERSGDILACLVTHSGHEEQLERYAARLLELHPEITTFVHGVNTKLASTAICERERVLFGPGHLRERLAGLELRVSAGSFFQTNTRQAERLFELVREEAGPARLAWDLFSGTGLIALVLASGGVERVVGIELVPSAVQDARRNAQANGITNVELHEADVDAALSDPGRFGLTRPDLVVVDPPRAGLHPATLGALCALGPPRLVYVSCNPTRTAVELAHFMTAGYRLIRARPVDLFPHTPHVECVFTLERRERGA